MIGVIIFIIVLLVVIPVGFLMTMGGLAAGLGSMVGDEVDTRFEGTEALKVAREGHSLTPATDETGDS